MGVLFSYLSITSASQFETSIKSLRLSRVAYVLICGGLRYSSDINEDTPVLIKDMLKCLNVTVCFIVQIHT